MLKRWFSPSIILLTVVLVLALWFRFYQLGKVPISLYWDEAAMLVDARVVAQTGLDMHGRSWLQPMFISYGDFKLPVYLWLASLSVKLLGVSEFALRLPSTIAGFLSVVLAGLLACELFGLKEKSKAWILELTAMLVVAISPWSILFSRTAFEGHLGQFSLGLAVLFALKSKQQSWFIWLAQFFATLATYSYFSVRFVWPVVFFSWWVWRFALSGSIKKLFLGYFKALLWLILPLLLYAVSLWPLLHSPFYQESQNFRLSTTSILNVKDWAIEANKLRLQAGNSFVDRVFYNRYTLIGQELAKNYADHLSLNYLFFSGDPNLRHGTGRHGLFLCVFLPIFLLGLYSLAKKYRPQLVFLLIWWLVALLPASVPETTPHALRSLNALLPLSLINGFGLFSFVEWLLFGFKNRVLAGFILLAAGAFLVWDGWRFADYYFNHYPSISFTDWQGGYKALAAKIDQGRSGVRTVWVNPFDDRFYLWLLAYGPYSAEEIQTWLKDEYKLDEVGNVTLHPFDWEKLDTLDHRVLVVGKNDDIDYELSQTEFKPEFVVEIQNFNYQPVFKMVAFGQ